MSGQGLAAAAGIDKGYLSRLERGEYDSPDPRILLRLARALEVDVADLYLAAGYAPGRGLPSMKPYLRAKYGLPEQVIQQIDEYVEMLTERYGDGKEEGDDDGPARAA